MRTSRCGGVARRLCAPLTLRRYQALAAHRVTQSAVTLASAESDDDEEEEEEEEAD